MRFVYSLAIPMIVLASACGGGSDSVGSGSGGISGLGGNDGGTGGLGGIAATGGATASTSGLPVPPGAGTVAQPSGTPGNLKVLPWAGFKAAVSYTFDDGTQSQIANYGQLQALGVRFTFYLVTNWGGASNAIWKQAIKDGHEIGNHTKTHQQVGTDADVDAATDFIKTQLGVTPYTMAAPMGDASYAAIAKTRFLLNRGVVNGLIGPDDGSDPFNTPCFVPATGALAGAFNDQVNAARTAGKWKIVLVHGFTGDTSGAYQPVDVAEFIAGVTYAKSLGDVWIDSMVNVGAYWRGQKTFDAVQPTTSGNTQTWTWTLPANFPPGKFLRVKVDGGTLSQGGTPLAWDSHGYYEVALDAGSLTLSP